MKKSSSENSMGLRTFSKKEKILKFLILTIGILIIPVIYCATYVSSVWDVYNNTGNLPVAVVNEDKGTTYEGKYVNYGDELVSNLENNDKMDWRFVTKEQADEGIQDGKEYYAVISIPEDFSEDLISLTTNDKEQATLTYTANETKNYIASMILKSAISTLKLEMNSKETEKIADTLVSQLKEVPDQLQTANDGVEQLKNGSQQLDSGYTSLIDGNSQITDGLQSASDGLSSAKAGADQLNSATQSFSTLINGADQLYSGSKSIQSASEQLYAGSSAVTSGIQKVSDGLNTFESQVTDSIESSKEGIATQVSDGVSTALSSLYDGEKGLNTFADGVTSYSEAVDKYIYVVNTYGADSDVAKQIAQQLQVYGTQMRAGASAVQASRETLQTGLVSGITTPLGASLDTLVSGISAGVSQIQNGILGDNGSGTSNGSTALLSGSQQVTSGLGALSSGAETLTSGAGQLATGTTKLNDLSDGISSLADGVGQLQSGTNQLLDGSKSLGDGLNTASDGNKQITEGLITLNDAFTTNIADANEKLTVTDGLSEAAGNGVVVETESYNHVKTYGESFAPYFFNISLWVGSLTILLVMYYDYDRTIKSLGPESHRIVLRFVAFLLMAVGQALLCGTVLQFAVGISVTLPVEYYVGLMLISVVYVVIQQFLMIIFGDVGRLLSIVLMVLQLTSTGGTFPIELNPPFFQAINPFMPMTYGVQLMKEAVTGHSVEYAQQNMWMLFIFGVVALGLLMLGNLIKKIVKIRKMNEGKLHFVDVFRN